MVIATWRDTIIAQSDATLVVEGNHYFPPDAVRMDLLEDSGTHSTCPWKGVASYKTIVVAGERNADAVWYYPDPKSAASNIAGYFAFWKGVKVA
ncbi:MAG: DUF427 domain-containing protein [Sphingomonas sp.]|uniref:DUF427 domain-containing protein n=1 Tax=Sphingomonas sp. TaxID=28214 RepID=UPI000DB2D162|nr:hypothetical protein [Zymomonas sp.]MBA4772339.1 DUF427 domain-containing protein [Sphingomonas sp.]PZP11224.1 MAG: hypothetical protein DI607_10975 [Sphingomonas hengshuiensis]